MPPPRHLCGLAALSLALAGIGTAASTPGSALGAIIGGHSCHGQQATLVGTPGADLRGTDGPDVIVTNGAADTYAGAGDDLVCVTGGARLDDADVLADEGNDVVDTTASEAKRAFTSLGPGDDTFTGGPLPDGVEASDPWGTPRHQGADAISTGGGDDWVVSGGAPGDRDHDAIDLGGGDDEVQLDGPVDPTLPILGGPGSDELELSRSTLRRAAVIDNVAGEATYAGQPMLSWSDLENFGIAPWGAWAAPSFVGGDGPEQVWSVIPLTSADLGGGNDRLNLHLHTKRLIDDASYVGGAGYDALVLNADAGDQARRVDLDLAEGHLLFRPDDVAVRARVDGLERFRLSSWRLDVRGTAETDHVFFSGCRGVVAGGPGDDLLEAVSIPDAGCGYLGEDAQLVTRGGGGDDTLRGEYMPDVLIGGPGTDLANGRRNTDRCVAETVLRCER